MSQISPRDSIKAVWRRWADVVKANRGLDEVWGDAFQQRNSLTDAQLLLTLLVPESDLPEFSLSGPLSEIAAESLKDLNAKARQSIDKGLRETLEDLLVDFFEMYQPKSVSKSARSKKSDNGAGVSRARRYDFTAPSKIDLERDDPASKKLGTGRTDITSSLEVVDSYSASLVLCLNVLLLNKRRATDINPGKEQDRWNSIAHFASERLTEAMKGLLASFAIYDLDTGEWEDTVRRDWPESEALGSSYFIRASEELSRIRSELRGLGDASLKPGKFFEFGWSWGPLSPEDVLVPDETSELDLVVREFSAGLPVHAFKAPYFYFTASALDAIDVLSSQKVSAAEILNDDQLVFASRLRNLASLTKRYWATVALARDGTGLWAVQQIPWIPADGEEFASEYWNLYILRLIFDRLPPGADATGRAIKIAEDLAARARITQAPSPRLSDAQVVLIHQRGQQLGLEASAASKDAKEVYGYWRVNDFGPQLLRVTASLLSLTTDPQLRQRVTTLLNDTWQHLESRREEDSTKYAWDSLRNSFVDRGDRFQFWEDQKGLQPSDAKNRVENWYLTFRIIEALVASSKALEVRPDAARQVQQLSIQLLSELEWLIESDDASIAINREQFARDISTARAAIEDRPAIAVGIALKLAMNLAEISNNR